MKAVTDNTEATSKDVHLLAYYESINQFQDKIDDIIKRIKNRDKKSK